MQRQCGDNLQPSCDRRKPGQGSAVICGECVVRGARGGPRVARQRRAVVPNAAAFALNQVAAIVCRSRGPFSRRRVAAAAVGGDRPGADEAPGRWHYALSDALLASRAQRPTSWNARRRGERAQQLQDFAIFAVFGFGNQYSRLPPDRYRLSMRRHDAANCGP